MKNGFVIVVSVALSIGGLLKSFVIDEQVNATVEDHDVEHSAVNGRAQGVAKVPLRDRCGRNGAIRVNLNSAETRHWVLSPHVN
jgi:hypothetical protein